MPWVEEINWRSSRELHSEATLQREWLFLCNKTVFCSMRPLPPRHDAKYHALSWNIHILTYSQGLLALSSPFRIVIVFVFPAVIELCNRSWLLYTVFSRHISSIIYRYPSYVIPLLTFSSSNVSRQIASPVRYYYIYVFKSYFISSVSQTYVSHARRHRALRLTTFALHAFHIFIANGVHYHITTASSVIIFPRAL